MHACICGPLSNRAVDALASAPHAERRASGLRPTCVTASPPPAVTSVTPRGMLQSGTQCNILLAHARRRLRGTQESPP
eukprot:1183741-Prorocentrum_minimum.AAC.2